MPRDILKNILRKKLAWGCAVIVLTQILGMLPALDFLSPQVLKLTSFAMGCALTVAKGVEMFFDQSASLEKDDAAECSHRQSIGEGPRSGDKSSLLGCISTTRTLPGAGCERRMKSAIRLAAASVGSWQSVTHFSPVLHSTRNAAQQGAAPNDCPARPSGDSIVLSGAVIGELGRSVASHVYQRGHEAFPVCDSLAVTRPPLVFDMPVQFSYGVHDCFRH